MRPCVLPALFLAPPVFVLPAPVPPCSLPRAATRFRRVPRPFRSRLRLSLPLPLALPSSPPSPMRPCASLAASAYLVPGPVLAQSPGQKKALTLEVDRILTTEGGRRTTRRRDAADSALAPAKHYCCLSLPSKPCRPVVTWCVAPRAARHQSVARHREGSLASARALVPARAFARLPVSSCTAGASGRGGR